MFEALLDFQKVTMLFFKHTHFELHLNRMRCELSALHERIVGLDRMIWTSFSCCFEFYNLHSQNAAIQQKKLLRSSLKLNNLCTKT